MSDTGFNKRRIEIEFRKMTTSDLHQRLLHQLDRVKALNTSSFQSSANQGHPSRTGETNAEPPHIPALGNGKTRDEIRPQVQKTGSISYAGGDLDVACEISDLTSSGARLRLAEDVTIPSCFDLTILPGNTSRKAQVCWRDDQELGIQFIEED